MKRALLLIVLITAQIHSFAQSRNNYIFESPLNRDGFTFNEIRCIATDHNQMLWFGCDNGLFYYNNHRFILYSFDESNPYSIPSNSVTNLLYDSSDRLWIVTDKGICRYNSADDNFERVDLNMSGTLKVSSLIEYRKDLFLIIIDNKLYSFAGDDASHLNIINTEVYVDVSSIYCDSRGTIYVGFSDGRVYSSTSELDKFDFLVKGEANPICTICEGRDNLFVGYDNAGVDEVSRNGSIINKYRQRTKNNKLQLPNNNVRSIVARADGDIWVATKSGIGVITDKETIRINASEYNQLPRSNVHTLHVDASNSVWVGTWAGGICCYNDYNYRFRYGFKESTDRYFKSLGLVHHFATNDTNTTWIGTERSGISLYNHHYNTYSKSFCSNLSVKALHKDDSNTLWIGTISQGVYQMNTVTKVVKKIELPNPFNAGTVISTITTDEKSNRVWIGSRNEGILEYNTQTGESIIYDYRNTKGLASNQIWSLSVVDDKLIICSDSGVSIRDNKSGVFTTYPFNNSRNANSCSYSMCYDEVNNQLYIGTKEAGIQLFDINSCSYKHLECNILFKNYIIYNIQLDSNGALWCSTNNGICRYTPQDDKVKRFNRSDGLSMLQFHPGSSATNGSNVLFFGSTNGFFHIDTDNIRQSEIAPRTFISTIKINNESISSDNCISIDSKHFADISQIELIHDNNTITFELTSDNMIKPLNSRFKYRLKGYQDDWVAIDRDREITFTKLPFGQYTLEVQSCNDGLWGDITPISIKINPPLYLTWYAMLLYIFIFIIIVIIVLREVAFKIKAKRDIKLEREINIINSKSFDEKVKFFMNISHELRTPLSLIKAPLTILEHEVNSQEAQHHIAAIKRNTERLLKLTNQILDFRLLEVGKLKASPSRVNVVGLCREVADFFEYQIKDQQVNFTFEQSSEQINAMIDYDMTSKVVYNILSNALKYTDTNASITLHMESCEEFSAEMPYDMKMGSDVEGKSVIISIEDDGMGIARSQIDHIFERFYFNANEAYSSSGIGLHMCFEYVNLHDGCIYVKSTEGVGTKFTIVLPSQCNNIVEEQSSISTTPYVDLSMGAITDSQIESVDQYKSTILIVDDNAEIRFYLKKILGRTYNCVTAKNGQQGYDFAIDIKPSLIILDVLMPVMSGVECAHKLRENAATRLTPIVMLTSLTDDNSVVQGVKAGANAYLSKPIDEALLFAHIERLITLSTDINCRAPKSSDNSGKGRSAELSFAEMIEAIMEENLQNNMLDVNLLSQQMRVSRSTLQRNFKSEIGMGVAEYIRDYRLRSAVQLMESGIYNIDELSICVGFNSSSYFCKAFKDKYGVSPKRYYDSLKESLTK